VLVYNKLIGIAPNFTVIDGFDEIAKFLLDYQKIMTSIARALASIPKVVGSIPTVARHIFQACPVWIYTQSNITNIMTSIAN
jgi:hypothetical protein